MDLALAIHAWFFLTYGGASPEDFAAKYHGSTNPTPQCAVECTYEALDWGDEPRPHPSFAALQSITQEDIDSVLQFERSLQPVQIDPSAAMLDKMAEILKEKFPDKVQEIDSIDIKKR